MSSSLVNTITPAGLAAVVNAQSNGLQATITHIAHGDRTPSPTSTLEENSEETPLPPLV